MFARRVSMQLKPNTAPELSQRLEKDVLPILRRQKGFQDEITLVATGEAKAVGISLWDTKESADTYNRETYPEVLKLLSNFMEGTPRLQTYEVANSTCHNIAAKVPATV